MKKITIEKILYDFEEVRKKALEKNRFCLVDDYSGWYQNIFWECEDELKNMGFLNPTIYFSGFSSQGDGACFDAKIDVEKLIDYLFSIKKLLNQEAQQLKEIQDSFDMEIITINHHYSHERTRKIDISYYNVDTIHDAKLIEKLRVAAEELRLEKSKEIYKRLEDEYDGLTSDEALTDWLTNTYWFDEDGNICESK